MAGHKLSREEVEKRRVSLRAECQDYAPTRGGHQCQQYAGRGACKRDDYFMCVVWAKRHPEEMYHLQQEQQESRKREPAQRAKEPAPPQQERQPEEKYPAKPAAARVYDLSNYGVAKKDDGRHLLDKPELLTGQAVEALSALGIEVTVKTSAGMEVTLVPALTDADRCELTFESARTLVMVLQVFPGATIEQITLPTKEKVS